MMFVRGLTDNLNQLRVVIPSTPAFNKIEIEWICIYIYIEGVISYHNSPSQGGSFGNISVNHFGGKRSF